MLMYHDKNLDLAIRVPTMRNVCILYTRVNIRLKI